MDQEKINSWLQSLEDPGQIFALGQEIGCGNSSGVHEATTNGVKLVQKSKTQYF